MNNAEPVSPPASVKSCSDSAGHRTLAVSAGAVGFLIILAWISLKFGLNAPPSATGDEPSYDSIGWQIAQGNGFREDVGDPDFRRPYDDAAVTDPELMTLMPVQAGTVTYRPPLFPGLIAAMDLIAGRQFWAIRLFNVTAICLSGILTIAFVAAVTGRSAAMACAALFFLADTRTRLFARTILTEPTAVLLMSILTLLLVRMTQRPDRRTAIMAGVVCGLSILNRTAIVLWLPVLLPGLWLLIRRTAGHPDSEANQEQCSAASEPASRTPLAATAAILWMTIATVVVGLPWGIRNCMVLGELMPLGAQGMMELPAAFSDQAVERQGIWFGLNTSDVYPGTNLPDMSRLQKEAARAKRGRELAMTWIRNHPVQAMELAPIKVFQEYRPRTLPEWLIGGLAVVGALATWRQRSTQVFILLHLSNAFAIACTWSVEGRFVVPLLFSVHVLAATGLFQLVRRLRWNSVTPATGAPTANS
ncbi:MAG: phospholipid carrier-dependent glycosyltransferase [Planctomycetaceae bacterium]